jgi:cytochrome c oxidase subunit 2
MNEFMRQILFLPLQRSTVARDIDTLHYFVISVTMAGSLLVFLSATALVVKYRRRGDDDARRARPAEATSAARGFELVILVGLLCLFLMWWVIGSRQFARIRVAPDGALEIYVTAKQWMWKFSQTSGRRTIGDLYVPARRPIKLIMTSRDVIHSFYVPEFRIKQDVIPGRYTTAWFEATEPGAYQILCAEFCGAGHSTMLGRVIALEPGDYERWLEGQPRTEPLAGEAYPPPYADGDRPVGGADLVRIGQGMAAGYGCLKCHSTDGSAHIGPTFAGLYESRVHLKNKDDVVADEAYMTESMMDPLAKVVRGYEPLMPSFLGRIRPSETAAILEFIKSLRDVPRLGQGGEDPGPVHLGSILP